MALYATPEEHAANSPKTWEVARVPTSTTTVLWVVRDQQGTVMETCRTQREARSYLADGFCVRLWHRLAAS